MTNNYYKNTSKIEIRDFERELDKLLKGQGLYFRLFSRIKSDDSINKKIAKKRIEKNDPKYIMQDYIGFRIVLYFKEDIKICEELLSNKYEVISSTVDDLSEENFSPKRINYVLKIPECYSFLVSDSMKDKVDNTFEVQLRTILSEGWHEVEHDLRYKCKESWDNYRDDSRTLNGILATLENCDWAISKLFDELSYKNYKNHEWEEMIKNKFRVHFDSEKLSDEIKNELNNNIELAKAIFRSDRLKILSYAAKIQLPFNYNNFVYIVIKMDSPRTSLEIPKIIENEN